MAIDQDADTLFFAVHVSHSFSGGVTPRHGGGCVGLRALPEVQPTLDTLQSERVWLTFRHPVPHRCLSATVEVKWRK
ncbi:hypothetical protein GWI33_000185 [Rhynchophorus ferrugineus]|uniref:Uncharacterized protein n=1 Tax=Rhynchophorus ferrugineus TaxID=354439 RepID=A0A834J3M3_RHYFE|nr:hypothetical protein GWI33_000185 [Rhynchophorus ferrugineus]